MDLHQKYAENLLANLYDMDTSIDVFPEYLKQTSKEELFENFIKYRNAITEMFKRISQIEMPDFFVFPLQSEKNYDLRIRDAIIIPMRCIFAVLYVVGRYGILEDDYITVSKKVFKEQLKKVKKIYVQNAVQLLADNGFHFGSDVFGKGSDFKVSYPDNTAVLAGLASFSSTIEHMNFNISCYDYGKAAQSFTLLNVNLYKWHPAEEKPYELLDLQRFICKQEDKAAVEQFHNSMVKQGYDFQYNISTLGGRNASIRYQTGKYDPYALVVARNDGKAYIGLKMRTLRNHTKYIQQCSNTFKDGFNYAWKDCTNTTCPHGIDDMTNCECRVCYTSEDKSYDKCTNTGWEYTWDRTTFLLNEADFDSYFYFIKQKHKKSTRVML